ncbi:MAG TPA: adenylosuccinate lyase [Acidimicrobiia bacterium]
MIDRYSLPEIAGLFTDEARFRTWLEVEVLATEAWAKLGMVPAADAAAIRERADFDVEAIRAREAVTDHETAAFVDVVQERIGGAAAKWVHYGLTSYDVVDTGMAVTLMRATDLVIDAVDTLEAAVAQRAREHRDTPMAGRTHGIHAEPITFGSKLALWSLQLRRDRVRLARARTAIAVGKLSGAVGTYSNVDPQVEAFVCERLGLRPVPSTQVIARDRHAELLYACASFGATVESCALEIRHLQRTEVHEVEEPFAAGQQKGSSAMPHKRNPWRSEQLCGLARVLRGNLMAGLEDVALWHERDMSHSSVERIVLTDSLLLAYYMAVRLRGIVAGLVVHADRMRENLDASYGLVFSEAVLLALVESGLARDDAYRLTQRAATRTWEERRPFRAVLADDAEIGTHLSAARLDQCFDLDRAVAHAARAVDALDVSGDAGAGVAAGESA